MAARVRIPLHSWDFLGPTWTGQKLQHAPLWEALGSPGVTPAYLPDLAPGIRVSPKLLGLVTGSETELLATSSLLTYFMLWQTLLLCQTCSLRRVGRAGQPRVSAVDLKTVRVICWQYLAVGLQDLVECLLGSSSGNQGDCTVPQSSNTRPLDSSVFFPSISFQEAASWVEGESSVGNLCPSPWFTSGC